MPSNISNESAFASKSVIVAPLVLLSVVDHYNRVAKDTKKRCVGVILGDNSPNSNQIRVSNSFAIPFEEDDKNPNVWFLDHNYIESMNDMFKKINAKEKLIGWYHSGPKLRKNDLKINDLFKKYTPNPLLLIVDVKPNNEFGGLPTDSYIAIEEIKDDGSSSEKTFVHIPSIIEAEEAEEIGVEHLLRDIRDQAAGNLSLKITNQLQSLNGLNKRLKNILNYLNKVINKELPINHVILGKLQDIFNLLPNLINPADLNPQSSSIDNDITNSITKLNLNSNPLLNSSPDLNNAFTVKTNDQLMLIYISSLVRAIISFHDLIDNKIENKKLSLKEKTTDDTDNDSNNTSDENSKEKDDNSLKKDDKLKK
ncbi:proteasome regulatory particle lid subunit RPN8 [Ascoidea rubescens DSM 1968]|uniref:26S proteasome regulatory subunit RPN8 n=1 Tax=Ascoidea rubescens DSM 1968 TaxID=1344418 RepID=A0A1D2VJ41_9ASCO|nr:Mov34-domain-containing protein [Ascoidea rubescens DSM 1968]ODV61553.1 Mov34-domain-containing protein [Ascoidea rubescens DSM 1968]